MIRLLLILLCLVSSPVSVWAEDAISSLNVDIQVQDNSSVQVREIYIMNVGESWFELPFVRKLPRYFIMQDGFPHEANYKVLNIIMDNQYLRYTTTKSEDFYYINMGDRNQAVGRGRHRLILEYAIPNMVQYSSQYDFLDWQALVNYTDFPILRTKVQVHLPKRTQLVSQSGRLMVEGEFERPVIFRQFTPGKFYTNIKERLNTRDLVTFRLGWPKGVVKEPSFNEKTLRFILRYPVYFLYSCLLLVYVFAFMYLFAFSARKDILRIFQRFSPATLFAFEYGEFNYKCLLLAIVRMAGLGSISIIYQKGNYLLNLKTSLRLTPFEQKLYDILQRQGKGHYVQLNELEVTRKDVADLAHIAARELNLPKAEYQKYFFILTFLLSLVVLWHTFGRYQPLFCLGVMYLLFVIPSTLQYFAMRHIPFKVSGNIQLLPIQRYKVYGLHFVACLILFFVSSDEWNYFLFRAPQKDYEIFQIIGFLNYANVILYTLQTHRHLVQVKRRMKEFKDYFLDPFNHKLKESNRLYNSERLFSHYLSYAMVYNAETYFAEYCSHAFLRSGGERYQIKWFKLDGDFEGSFEGIARFLSRDFMLNMKMHFADEDEVL